MQEARDKRILAEKENVDAPDAKRSQLTNNTDGGANYFFLYGQLLLTFSTIL